MAEKGNNKKDNKLSKFEEAEKLKAKEFANQNDGTEQEEIIEHDADLVNVDDEKDEKDLTVIDGYRKVDKSEMPFGGKLYPVNWDFYYRCPTTKEVANFSTINQEDKTAIIKGVSALITKCFTIFNSDTEREIKSEQINDGERLFFFLLLREYYLNDAPIQYNIVDEENSEDGVLKVNFFASSLIYEDLKPGLLKLFDGRLFKFKYSNDEDLDDNGEIKFLIPTLKTTSRIIKYMEVLHKKVSDTNKDGISKEDFNKQFMLFAPFLYETGTESVDFLRKKFITLQKNDVKYKKLNSIVSQLQGKLTNLETIKYIVGDDKDNSEVCLMKFPGGWKNMFVDNTEFSDVF